jgi:hypothetical protein
MKLGYFQTPKSWGLRLTVRRADFYVDIAGKPKLDC